ncbi:LPXTG cell wall anchor domain-containing protein [Clostridium sp.]|uniref:LPXTG cell wall anchor domain-containing protein n=1 Tax=Clostridium sp. TaxID=1506 RepID=UPI00343F04A1
MKEAIKVLDNKEATQQEVDEALKGLELALGSLELAQGNNNNNSGNTDNDNTNNDSSDNNVNDNLPATGDSSTFALVVSAALLLGSGFVLKKRK